MDYNRDALVTEFDMEEMNRVFFEWDLNSTIRDYPLNWDTNYIIPKSQNGRRVKLCYKRHKKGIPRIRFTYVKQDYQPWYLPFETNPNGTAFIGPIGLTQVDPPYFTSISEYEPLLAEYQAIFEPIPLKSWAYHLTVSNPQLEYYSMLESIAELRNSLTNAKLEVLYLEFNLKILSDNIWTSKYAISSLISEILILLEEMDSQEPVETLATEPELSYDDKLKLETDVLIDLSIEDEVKSEYVDIQMEPKPVTTLTQEVPSVGLVWWMFSKISGIFSS